VSSSLAALSVGFSRGKAWIDQYVPENFEALNNTASKNLQNAFKYLIPSVTSNVN
jgi:hypothetical protein